MQQGRGNAPTGSRWPGKQTGDKKKYKVLKYIVYTRYKKRMK
jgi:hypothetical protein